MTTALRQYLDEHDGKCPTDPRVLVEYAKNDPDLDEIQWIDAHLRIEHYQEHQTILTSSDDSSDGDSDSDTGDERERASSDNGRQSITSRLSAMKRTIKSRTSLIYSPVSSNENGESGQRQRAQTTSVLDQQQSRNNNNGHQLHQRQPTSSTFSGRAGRHRTRHSIHSVSSTSSSPYYYDGFDGGHAPRRSVTVQSRSSFHSNHQYQPDTVRTMRKSISWETNHQLLYPQKYPTRARRESQVTDPCISCIDVVVLCFCTFVIAIVGYLIFRVGADHYLHSIEYDIEGQCECIDDSVANLGSGERSYEWRIWGHTICKGQRDANYTFFIEDSMTYVVGQVHECYTNDECDEIHLEVEHHLSKSVYLYVGGVVFVISICCGITAVLCYCKLCKTKKLLHCEYCRECMDYFNGRDREDWYQDQLMIFAEQQRQFGVIMEYMSRTSGVEIEWNARDLIAQYYHTGGKSIDTIIEGE